MPNVIEGECTDEKPCGHPNCAACQARTPKLTKCVCYETGESNYDNCATHGAVMARVKLRALKEKRYATGLHGHFIRQEEMDEWLRELITPMLNDISKLMPGDAYDGDAGMDYLVLVWVRDLISGSPERVYRALGIDLGEDE